MKASLQRRRFIQLVGAATAMACLPGMSGAASARFYRWRGYALGAEVEMLLAHERAEVLCREVLGKLQYYESIFSLYQPHSALCRLNADGRLANPPMELLEVLRIASQIHLASHGYFDVTIGSLYRLYQTSFRNTGRPPAEHEILAVLENTGMRHVEISEKIIRFRRPGMAVTLNGIAQGYITDRVTAWLRGEGVQQALVHLGEYAAIGSKDKIGSPWKLLSNGNKRVAELHDYQALATSSSSGTRFDAKGRYHHLLNPLTGRPEVTHDVVSILAEEAVWADGLSTAASFMTRHEIAHMMKKMPASHVYL